MDLTSVAAELLDAVPVHRTLGVHVDHAGDGSARVSMSDHGALHNVIGALHSSGLTALVDAAGLAAILSVAPDEQSARRLQPLGLVARMRFHIRCAGAHERPAD